MAMRQKRRLFSANRLFPALALAGALAGCSAGPVIDRVPTELGGLPSGTPQRPQAPPPFPSVHDVPPARPTTTLTDQEQLKLEKELSDLRQKQGSLQDSGAKDRAAEANAKSAEAMQKAKAAAKKKPPSPNPQ